MEFNNAERDVLLAALFALRIAQAENSEKAAQIEALAVKLGGDPDTALFGAYRHSVGDRGLSVPDYPADDTDEG
jgi:hypothetical protein